MGGYVARMGKRRGAYGVLERNMKERDDLRNLGVDVRILYWTLKKEDAREWCEYIWLRI
jgi:hypothetical protein